MYPLCKSSRCMLLIGILLASFVHVAAPNLDHGSGSRWLKIISPKPGDNPCAAGRDMEISLRSGVPIGDGQFSLGLSMASYSGVFYGPGASSQGNLTLRFEVPTVKQGFDTQAGYEIRFVVPAREALLAGEEKAHFAGWTVLEAVILAQDGKPQVRSSVWVLLAQRPGFDLGRVQWAPAQPGGKPVELVAPSFYRMRKVCLPLSKDELALHLYGDWKGTTVPGKGQNGAGMRILPGQHHLRFMSNWALRQSLGSSAESSLRVDLHDAEFPATGGNARGKEEEWGLPDVYVLPPHAVSPMGEGTHFTHLLGDVILPAWAMLHALNDTSPRNRQFIFLRQSSSRAPLGPAPTLESPQSELWAALTNCPSTCVHFFPQPNSTTENVPWTLEGACFPQAVVGNALEPRGWHIVSFPLLWSSYATRIRSSLRHSPLSSLRSTCPYIPGRLQERRPLLLLLRRTRRDVANPRELLFWATDLGWTTNEADLGQRTLMEQVQLVQDSHTTAGIHGNAQAACWFSPRGATLIDIQPHATSLPGRAPEDHPQFITSWLRVISDEIDRGGHLRPVLTKFPSGTVHSAFQIPDPFRSRFTRLTRVVLLYQVPQNVWEDLLAHAYDAALVLHARPLRDRASAGSANISQVAIRARVSKDDVGSGVDELNACRRWLFDHKTLADLNQTARVEALWGVNGREWERYSYEANCSERLTRRCAARLPGATRAVCEDICEITMQAQKWNVEEVIAHLRRRVRFLDERSVCILRSGQVNGTVLVQMGVQVQRNWPVSARSRPSDSTQEAWRTPGLALDAVAALQPHIQDLILTEAAVIARANSMMEKVVTPQSIWAREVQRMKESRAALRTVVEAMNASKQLDRCGRDGEL